MKSKWLVLGIILTCCGSAFSDTETNRQDLVTVSYSVRFDANGGEGEPPAPQQHEYGRVYTLPANTFVRPGYDFAGWSDKASGTVVWAEGAAVSNLAAVAGTNVTIYAAWQQTAGAVVYYDTDGKTWTGVTVATNQATLFTGLAATNATSFTIVVTNSATCRVSLDPITGPRLGSTLTVDAQTVSGTWQRIIGVTDRDRTLTNATFDAGTTYRFAISTATNRYRYVVGLNQQGVVVKFDPCRSASVDEKAQLSCACSVGYPYGWAPTLERTSSNEYFKGWYDSSEKGRGAPLVLTELVRADRTAFYAQWTNQTWFVIFDWNLARAKFNTTNEYGHITTTNYYANGEKIGTPKRPTQIPGDPLGWNTLADGTGAHVSSTNLVYSNQVVYAQWSSDWVLSLNGGGWAILGCTGPAPVLLDLPEELEGKPVTAIADRAFAGEKGVLTVLIPESIRSIGDSAFADCTSLMRFEISFTEPAEDDETGYLEDGLELGAAAFSGCTSLLDCELPPGPTTFPDEVFAGCTSLEECTMPFTVTEIGERALADCIALKKVVVPEKVTTIGSGAFSGCKFLKSVWYLGNAPSDVADDIYEGASTKLRSFHYLKTEGWPAMYGFWPTSGAKRRTSGLSSSQCARATVVFDWGGRNGKVRVPYVVGRPFAWLAQDQGEPETSGEDETDQSGELEGWYTARAGGVRVGNYVTIDSALKVYAHYGLESSSGARAAEVSWDDGLFDESSEAFAYKAAEFRGLVLNTDGDVVGEITLSVQRGVSSKDGDHKTSSVSGVMVMMGSKSEVQITGSVSGEGKLSARAGKYRLVADTLTVAGFNGSLEYNDEETHSVRCVNQKHEGVRENLSFKRSLYTGCWVAALKTGEIEDLGGGALADGYSTLNIEIQSTGNAKIVSSMADGANGIYLTSVIRGDGYLCLPILMPLYGFKGGFSGALWITWRTDSSMAEGDISLVGLTSWDASASSKPFVAAFDGAESWATRVPASSYEGLLEFDLDETPEIEGATIDDSLLPKGTSITAGKTSWILPKADRVRFADGTWVNLTADPVNPAGLKLNYDKASNRFTGAFAIRGVTDSGKKRTYAAKVTGIFSSRFEDDYGEVFGGCGTATVDGQVSIPVIIVPVEE